ncbi:MAG: hypothetical protein ABIP55_07965 [Tepidisphaeraceae bacterium]
MSTRFTGSFTVLALFFTLAGNASAVVVEELVTPESVKVPDNRFTVAAEKREDGLIQFTITYRLTAPRYLVAHVEVRDGETVVMKSDTPSFVHEDSATYHLALSPKHLAAAKFELSENPFGDSGERLVAMPGGTIYHVRLEAFAKDATAAKAE